MSVNLSALATMMFMAATTTTTATRTAKVDYALAPDDSRAQMRGGWLDTDGSSFMGNWSRAINTPTFIAVRSPIGTATREGMVLVENNNQIVIVDATTMQPKQVLPYPPGIQGITGITSYQGDAYIFGDTALRYAIFKYNSTGAEMVINNLYPGDSGMFVPTLAVGKTEGGSLRGYWVSYNQPNKSKKGENPKSFHEAGRHLQACKDGKLCDPGEGFEVVSQRDTDLPGNYTLSILPDYEAIISLGTSPDQVDVAYAHQTYLNNTAIVRLTRGVFDTSEPLIRLPLNNNFIASGDLPVQLINGAHIATIFVPANARTDLPNHPAGFMGVNLDTGSFSFQAWPGYTMGNFTGGPYPLFDDGHPYTNTF